FGAIDDLTTLHPQQRRDRVDVERERQLEVGVVTSTETLRKCGIVLRVDRERLAGVTAVPRQLCEHRNDELTRRAVALDDRDETVGYHVSSVARHDSSRSAHSTKWAGSVASSRATSRSSAPSSSVVTSSGVMPRNRARWPADAART